MTIPVWDDICLNGKRCQGNRINRAQTATTKYSPEPKDWWEYDSFGKHIASQLRYLSVLGFVKLLITRDFTLCKLDHQEPLALRRFRFKRAIKLAMQSVTSDLVLAHLSNEKKVMLKALMYHPSSCWTVAHVLCITYHQTNDSVLFSYWQI